MAAQKAMPETKKGLKIRAVIQPEKCKGCGICTAFCPEQMLVLGDDVNSCGYHFVKKIEGKTCRGCRHCYMMCPDVAFSFVREKTDHAADDERQ